MADFFKHRADAEAIAGERIKRTGRLSIIRMTRQHGGGFYVIDTTRAANARKPLAEIEVPMKRLVGTIDLTPSWSSVLPVYLEAYANATCPEHADNARRELERMARLADLYVASQKGRAA